MLLRIYYVSVYVYLKLHITAQFGPVNLSPSLYLEIYAVVANHPVRGLLDRKISEETSIEKGKNERKKERKERNTRKEQMPEKI